MGSYSSIGVQPTLCGKSSLVVVCFLCTRIDCIIHLYLQYVLVPFLGGIQDAYDLSTVLWIYGNDLFCYVTCNWNGWYINLLVVCEENFWNNQGGLDMLLVTGTVGTLTSLWFVRKIFGTIKVD